MTHAHANRLILDVEGAVADIEKTFHVTMRTYQHPTEARQFFSADVEPSLDAPVTVLEISGLNDYALPHPNLKPKPKPDGAKTKAKAGANAQPLSGVGPNGNYAGNDFRAAYVPGTALTGTGQSVGLLEFDGYYAADITAYETQFHLPNVPLVNVPIDGGVTVLGGGVREVSLDIEMVLSMSPGVGTIYVYESSGSWLDMLNQMANDDFANQLSCSWTAAVMPVPRGGSDLPADGLAGAVVLFTASGDSLRLHRGPFPFPSDSPSLASHVGGRHHADHRRSRWRLCFGNGLELGRRRRQQRRCQHHLHDSDLSAGHQHDPQPGIDDHAQHTGCGADRRQCMGHL